MFSPILGPQERASVGEITEYKHAVFSSNGSLSMTPNRFYRVQVRLELEPGSIIPVPVQHSIDLDRDHVSCISVSMTHQREPHVYREGEAHFHQEDLLSIEFDLYNPTVEEIDVNWAFSLLYLRAIRENLKEKQVVNDWQDDLDKGLFE